MTADEILSRMGPGEIRAVAHAAVALMLAEEKSLPEYGHREHVHGVIGGAAPTFSRSLRRLLRTVKEVHARQSVRIRRHA